MDNPAKPEHIKKVTNRAKEILLRARKVNAAQYAHGINTCIANLEWFVSKLEKSNFECDYDFLNRMGDEVMKLGGYLYSLKEGI